MRQNARDAYTAHTGFAMKDITCSDAELHYQVKITRVCSLRQNSRKLKMRFIGLVQNKTNMEEAITSSGKLLAIALEVIVCI